MDGNLAGFDTKIMKNCGKIHLKRTKIDHLMNRLVVLVSFPEPLPWVGRHGGGEGEGPTPYAEAPAVIFQASVSLLCQICSLILRTGLRARECFLRMTIWEKKKKVFIK